MTRAACLDTHVLRAMAAIEPFHPDKLSDAAVRQRAQARVALSHGSYRASFRMFAPALEPLLQAHPDLFADFLGWLTTQEVALDWTMYLTFLRWLRVSAYGDALTDASTDTAMVAAATHWTSMDRSRAAGIVLARRHHGTWIVAWKNRSLAHPGVVERVDVAAPLPSPAGPFGFFLAADFELDEFPGWSVPRY